MKRSAALVLTALASLLILIIGLVYYNIDGYLLSSRNDESRIERILFRARKSHLSTKEAVDRIQKAFPSFRVSSYDKKDLTLLPEFEGYGLISKPIVNHLGFGHESIWWLESDAKGKLVGAWRDFRMVGAL